MRLLQLSMKYLLTTHPRMVPSEYSSGERQQRGHISKAGPRYLLVESAWTILRRGSPTNLALHAWAKRIAERRGQRVAVVVLARKLAGYSLPHVARRY